MIPNQFIHINEKETFDNLKENIQDESIVFCKESGEIVTHGENYGKGKWKEIGEPIIWNPNQIDTCNVVLVDKSKGSIFQTPNPANFSKDKYIPIGIVVVPTGHNVYGDGSCGVMALLSASLTTPDEGQTSSVGIYWGQNNVDIALPNLNAVARQGTMYGNLQDAVDGTSYSGYMPLMRDGMSKNIECPTDHGTWYYDPGYSSYGYIPSPYLIDGTRNPLYYKTDSPSSAANAMSDFAGKSNTELLISLATTQSNWKTATNIENQKGSGYSPAACSCWRFHTYGTQQGEWYLPACGELGYCASRYDRINGTLSEINRAFGVSICQLVASNFWSSSECDSMGARDVYFSTGLMSTYSKGYAAYVRPFWRGVLPVRMGSK